MEDVFEKIVQDLLEKQYSVIDTFFDEVEVENLRNILLFKYEEDEFKKAAIGNVFNEQIVKTIRGDFISWIDEKEATPAEKVFFDIITDFTDYINRTCFL
uniref:2OG-Fe(II) oxygenase n=1 Tax=Flavobacterium sp. TaxID=239 RepID=UPI00404822DD